MKTEFELLIKNYISKKGISLNQFSLDAGVCHSQVNNAMKGLRPAGDSLCLLISTNHDIALSDIQNAAYLSKPLYKIKGIGLSKQQRKILQIFEQVGDQLSDSDAKKILKILYGYV